MEAVSLWELRRVVPTLADILPATYRMRDVQGRVFQVPWPDAAGEVRIVACPHLSGSFGLSRSRILSFGEALREAWQSSQ